MKRHWQAGVLLVFASLVLAFGVVIYLKYLAPRKDELPVTSHSISRSISSSVESIQKSIASSTEVETSSEPETFDVAPVRQAFESVFGQLKGQHSLYFQDLRHQQSQALVIGDTAMRSASTIKVLILATLYDEVAKGHLALTDSHTLSGEEIVGGTGNLQTKPAGSTYTLQELAQEMIVMSDNTATNILIDYLGMEKVNTFIARQGYTQTRLSRKMLDMAALEAGEDNYISVKEVGDLMAKLYRRQLVNPQADREMLQILKQQQDRSNLLANLPSGTTGYSKSGQFAEYGVRHDVAIIETPKGAFVLAVLSQDGEDSAQQQALQQFGQAVYQLFVK